MFADIREQRRQVPTRGYWLNQRRLVLVLFGYRVPLTRWATFERVLPPE